MKQNLEKLAKKMQDLFPDDGKIQSLFYEYEKIIIRWWDYYGKYNSQDLLDLFFLIYSYKETKKFEFGYQLIDNLSYANLFSPINLEDLVECSECDAYGDVICDFCGGDEIIDCPECDGSGLDSEGEPCEFCNGEGEVNCPECENGKVTCENCDGEGEYILKNSIKALDFKIVVWGKQFKDILELRCGTNDVISEDADTFFKEQEGNFIYLHTKEIHKYKESYYEEGEVRCESFEENIPDSFFNLELKFNLKK